jgi:hypothetical protein
MKKKYAKNTLLTKKFDIDFALLGNTRAGNEHHGNF